ncbi:MAG: isoleucine--tRNA ligase [Thermoanaerobaculia bacterium]|nr:isoleucine--tRNA ligase [Thermoanaerobaculia bacterium]
MSERRFEELAGGFPFPRLEHEVLARWRREGIFARTLARESPRGELTFYEGPPTANNAPHVGHVLTRVVKDLFPRFRTMQGFHVARKAGWDTHGLPVEIEVEKRAGISGKREIETLVPGDVAGSIAEFNRRCLESVMAYERQWRVMTERFGYWVDLDDAYFTYTNGYIESVWWALARLHAQGLLYEGHKSQPYCARCGTTLSSHEVAQNYKEVEDPSIWVLFPARAGQRLTALDGTAWEVPPGLSLVAWTTTPWTMPGHSGLAVHPEMIYRVVAHPGRADALLLIADTVEVPVPCEIERDGERVRLDLREVPALVRFTGRALAGLRYDRPYRVLPWDARTESAELDPPASDDAGWAVVVADYVTATDGTGLVHTAPAFGADDYATGVRWGLPLFQTIEPNGKVAAREGIEPFAGLGFKEADARIVRDLAARGLLLHTERYRHSYPFCWRCDQPLLQYARRSWFVRTTARKAELVALNRTIGWYPAHIGEGRFGNWLENVVDWALSRQRYWGTPLPIWRCDACDEVEVIGSYAALFARAGRTPPADPYDRAQFDPHRPFIDEVTWRCGRAGCGGTCRRVADVIDAWFDSGAMPFAQHHYIGRPLPHFDPETGTGYPAAFIAEAVDQTRGWFYTLHVLGTLLFDRVAYENCLVMGHVNDEQGRKMSKRLGNVVDPMAVVEETGADALRWYFYVSDPEQPSRFSARLVREAAQGLLLPLWHAASFFSIYAGIDGWYPGRAAAVPLAERTDLDRWILLRLDEEIGEITRLLEAYGIAEPARRLERFVDDLTNWYIRRSRERFWAGNPEGRDKESAYQTLYEVLTTLVRLLAPFVPFVTEVLHSHLVRSQDGEAPASVHLEGWPERLAAVAALTGEERREAAALARAMALAQRVVGLGRAARAAHDLKTRQPLAAVTLVAAPEAGEGDLRAHLERVREIVLDELNVKELRWAERRRDYVHHEVRPNFRLLGKRLGKRMPLVQAALAAGDGDQLAEALERDGALVVEIAGEAVRLAPEELEVRLIEREGTATQGDRELLVALDTALSPELVAEGRAREVVSRLQAARKGAGLAYTDRIRVAYRAAPELAAAIAAWGEWIAGETLALELAPAAGEELESAPVDGLDFAFAIART